MYTFWIVVIGFSMLSLMLIYIYQFDRFSDLLQEYAGIDANLWVFRDLTTFNSLNLKKKKFQRFELISNLFLECRQRDIGLEKYETKLLFLHLFYPTLLVVITVVQLQMFHKTYLEQLEMPSMNTNSISGNQPSSSLGYDSLQPESPLSDEHQKTKSHYTRINVSDLKNITTKQVRTISTMSIEEFSKFILQIWSHLFSGIKKSGSILPTNEMVFRHFLAIHGNSFHQNHSYFGIFAGDQWG